MVDWEAARAFTEQACSEIFDYTECQVQPRKPGVTVNHPTGNDPDREPFTFKGTIDLEPPSDRIPRHLSLDTGVRKGAISYDAVLAAHVGSWPYIPRREDHIIAGAVTWKIVAKEQDGSSRPAFYLSRV
ncbi:hypothetical protein MRS76_20395 [Rhizobiaceae bacterium n13]|uniref:hypothetical protein n=1 Tax=Ferirhizobium litorale TaxID=2927786 RepID=UPI0024B29F17|nr:hypothetical protein [Fererhizobium litorale]MDI7864302.1 hypothetical protein [Fererhizobium litorale]